MYTKYVLFLDLDNIPGIRYQRLHPMDTAASEYLPDDVTTTMAGRLQFHSKSDGFPAGVHVCTTPGNLYHRLCSRSAGHT